MATRTPSAPAETEKPGLTTYVVLVDAVNVVTGRKPNGHPAVTRMLRGELLHAPSTHPTVVELLGMRGIVEQDRAEKAVDSLVRKSNPKRPLAQHNDNGLRVTGAGVAAVLNGQDDPAMPLIEEALPLDAALPDEKAANEG